MILSTPLSVRVYYEDTDTAGIVYYANYLRFLERGRTEYLRELGFEQSVLAGRRVAFAVRSVQAEYLKPARLDDVLLVETGIGSLGRAQLSFDQVITRGQDRLLDAKIRVACIDPVSGKPIAIPAEVRASLQSRTDTIS
jgi:acyl-CoA thioester hydrolase